MRKLLYVSVFFAVISLTAFFAHITLSGPGQGQDSPPLEAGIAVSADEPEPSDRVEVIGIPEGKTYIEVMQGAGISYTTGMAIHAAAVDQYDLANVRAGKDIALTFDKDTDELKELYYQTGGDNELRVHRSDDGTWHAKYAPIPYDVKITTYHGTVENSLYQSALDANMDERAVIQFANAFEYTVDFSQQQRAGDTFALVIEERYLNGNYVMPGKMLAGRYVNDGETYELFYFEESEDNKTYFDAEGRTAQKMFLKAPVAYRYISSGFTTGRRYVEAFNVSTGHRAIDYAAAYGTPIRATADGIVTFAGWNGPYGNEITIRHNGTYSTNYAHQSKFAVKKGSRVTQGDVIGYVGSTGFSTGPHVHYEMVKNGVKINPLTEATPPGEPVSEKNKARFEAERERLRQLLNS